MPWWIIKEAPQKPVYQSPLFLAWGEFYTPEQSSTVRLWQVRRTWELLWGNLENLCLKGRSLEADSLQITHGCLPPWKPGPWVHVNPSLKTAAFRRWKLGLAPSACCRSYCCSGSFHWDLPRSQNEDSSLVARAEAGGPVSAATTGHRACLSRRQRYCLSFFQRSPLLLSRIYACSKWTGPDSGLSSSRTWEGSASQDLAPSNELILFQCFPPCPRSLLPSSSSQFRWNIE